MDAFSRYINPIKRLGKRKYSLLFPLLFSLFICIASEIIALQVLKDPKIVGAYIIWINVSSIIYFAFRDGIKGGVIAAIIPIFYYLYIIDTRNYRGAQLISGVETTIVLALLYFLMAGVIGWLKQEIDVLIEKEANERRRLQAIVDQLPVGVTITDSKGRIVQVNKKLDSILGVKIPKGYLIGGAPILPTAVKGETKYTPSQGPLAQVLYSGKATSSNEFAVTRKDGKKLYLQSSASVIRNDSGKVIAAAAITHDLTQQREMEHRKDDFVNMASHELKTPITSMKLYIESLLLRMKDHQDERSVKMLRNIQLQTERLQTLVNDLLDVSRLQTGKLTFTKETFRLDLLVAEAVEDIKGMAKGQEIVFTGKQPIKIAADKFRIYQVITNLITNAVKYSHNGKTIQVRVKRSDGKALVSIQDHGIGIAKDQQKKIFDRLYQVIDDKEKTFPGFGMGLYISKEIIKRHKGMIWVESEKGKGSTFFFTLPFIK
jgi:PAS domain S-box-containing protein